MGSRKHRYLAYLVFRTYVTSPWRAELTEAQAWNVAQFLEGQKALGRIKDFYLGPPPAPEYVHATLLNARSLVVELADMIEAENRV